MIKKFWNWGWGIYHKNEELWNYLIVGGLTTVVSFLSFWLATATFCDASNALELQIANVFSWICAVTFAYFTNRIFVFKSKSKNYGKEVVSFVSSRLVTLLIDMGIMALMVTIMGTDELLAKIIVQIVVTVLNYILSKIFVFKKKKM